MNSVLKSFPILFPNQKIDKSKWSVVSCDQFSSQRDYWQKTDEYVGGAPSTLRLILPEAYLEDADCGDRISRINQTMLGYLEEGVFSELTDSFVLVERDTKYGKKRLGIVAPVDLEQFSYCGDHGELAIRSTEGVVEERIPPRLKIRCDAPFELPHILLLIDDREKTVIEGFYKKRGTLKKLYDFDLNMDGGHVAGYAIDADEAIRAFERLCDPKKQIEKYGKTTNFVFAVGDGNHSLATAKAHWEKIKKGLSEQERQNHPARYALCEIENLHCDGIVFEPIHRCVFGAGEDLITYLKQSLSGDAEVEIVYNKISTRANIPSSTAQAISDIEKAVASYVKAHAGTYVDYIHGDEYLLAVADAANAVAIKMPKINKEDLFPYVLNRGPLCKKAFSMGEAEEKRYYLEAKRIK
jgi:hypothetical protein